MCMRYAVSMPNMGRASDLVELAVAVEEAGWDGFFLWDHLRFDGARNPPVHDPWVLLGAIAARTSRIRLGTLVTPVPRRRPWKLAKEVTTLDHLSAGRVILGVGLGVPVQEEYADFGEVADQRVHAARLDEGLILLDGWLRGDPVEFHGDHYQVTAQLHPAAVQRPRPPIWVAATLPARAGVRRAAKWDGIFPLHRTGVLPAAQLAEVVAELNPRPGPGYDVVAAIGPGAAPDELADAGATWLIDGPEGPGEPFDELRRRLENGPPGG
jgi:alkanesulfonate monooxygenase SsuD/methylene tetrahydromethanopterin reductase-like flavin-dependent oxidoreductase (luciferase family)